MPCAQEVGGCLRGAVKTQHAAVCEPKSGGHGTDVGASIFVLCSNEDDRGSPVEDRRGDYRVHDGCVDEDEFRHLLEGAAVRI